MRYYVGVFASGNTVQSPSRDYVAAAIADHRAEGAWMYMHVAVDSPPARTRRRMRVLTPHDVAAEVATVTRCLRDGKQAIETRAMHAGSVADAYHYPAHTDCCAVIGVRDPESGEIAVFSYYGRAPANKVTVAGACRRSVGGKRGRLLSYAYDSRVSLDRWLVSRDELRDIIVKDARIQHCA